MASLPNSFMSSWNGIRKVSGRKSDEDYEKLAAQVVGGFCRMVLLHASGCAGDRDLLSRLERRVVELVDSARRRLFQRERRRRKAHLYGRRTALDPEPAVWAYPIYGRRRCVGAFGGGRRCRYRLAWPSAGQFAPCFRSAPTNRTRSRSRAPE